jgi:hypothetical protein
MLQKGLDRILNSCFPILTILDKEGKEGGRMRVAVLVYYWPQGRDRRCVWSMRLNLTFGKEEMAIERDEQAEENSMWRWVGGFGYSVGRWKYGRF